MARKLLIVFMVAALSILVLASLACAEKRFLRMFSGPEGGTWYPLGAAMMAVLDKETKFSTSNGPGGGVSNAKAVNNNSADIGWTASVQAYNGYEGKGKFKKKLTNLRHLLNIYPGVFQIAVPKNSDIKSIADLKDKRICPGKVGFSTTATAETVLKGYGITFANIKKNGGVVNFVGFADSAALMQDGHSDAFMALTSCPLSTIMRLNFRPGVRFLGIDPDHMKKILAMEPGLMATKIPAGAYKGLTNDVPTVGSMTTLIVNKDLSDETAYNIVKILYSNWNNIAKVNKAILAIKPTDGALGTRIPIHPGALKYYKEIGAVK